MLELTAENTVAYLRERGQLDFEPADVEELQGGVSNVVLRITTPSGRFVLKQSRPQLRTRDPWFSDLDRIYREQEVMQALEPLLPPLTVPSVLFVDRPNFVYAMSHAPDGARVWKAELLAGQTDAALGERIGRVLGRMHESSSRAADVFRTFGNHDVFVQLRVDPFYRRVQERRREVAVPVGRIIEEMLSIKEALCHGDYTPKNILVHEHGFMLVDYETAHFGDPAMDLGLFLAHVLLKAARLPGSREGYFNLANAFWNGYRAETRFRSAEELQARGVQHLGVCLLARIDGTSPVDYLPEATKRDAVRRLGQAILLDDMARWEDVRRTWDLELRRLSEG